MSLINHTLIKYMLFHTYLDLLPLNILYFVLENGNFVLRSPGNVLVNNISLAVETMPVLRLNNELIRLIR